MAAIEKDDQADRLKAARRAAGFLSAADAANRHNWPYGSYSAHENGSRGIGRAVFRYAKAFRVSAAWLLTGEGPGPKGDDPEIAQAINELLAIYRRLPADRRRRLLEEARDQGRLGDLERGQSLIVPEDKAS